jgi:heme-degrading monooxygenase HmoA
MAVVMSLRWRGLTPEQYDQVRGIANWEGDRPKGGNFHLAGFDGDELRITDIWDSAEDFQSFQEGRLAAALQQAGVEGEPEVEIFPVHAIYAPMFEGAAV